MKIMMSEKTDNQTRFAVPIMVALQKEFSETVALNNYGNGVKEIGIHTDMRDSVLANTVKPRMPKYLKGKRTVEAHGVQFIIEDSLEISLRADPERIASAVATEDVVKEIYLAFEKIKPHLLKKKIPDFNMAQFVDDFSTFLGKKSLANGSASTHR